MADNGFRLNVCFSSATHTLIVTSVNMRVAHNRLIASSEYFNGRTRSREIKTIIVLLKKFYYSGTALFGWHCDCAPMTWFIWPNISLQSENHLSSGQITEVGFDLIESPTHSKKANTQTNYGNVCCVLVRFEVCKGISWMKLLQCTEWNSYSIFKSICHCFIRVLLIVWAN